MIKTGLKNLNAYTPKEESLSINEAAASVQEAQEYYARMKDEDQMEKVMENHNTQRTNINGESLTAKLEKLSNFYLISLDDLLIEMNKAGIYKANESDTFSRDENKALMKHLSDNGNAVAQFGTGESYYRDGQYKQAMGLWAEALLQEDMLPKSHLSAMSHNIGLAYYSGLGVISSKEDAIKWLIKSALIGESPLSQHAEYKLAEMYHKGDGIKKDTLKAKFWAQRSAKGNNNQISLYAKQFLERHAILQVVVGGSNEDRSPYEGVNWENEMPTKKLQTIDDDIPF